MTGIKTRIVRTLLALTLASSIEPGLDLIVSKISPKYGEGIKREANYQSV